MVNDRAALAAPERINTSTLLTFAYAAPGVAGNRATPLQGREQKSLASDDGLASDAVPDLRRRD
jgi:hypothetical protein